MRTYHILIVDDQRDARRVLRAGLETLPGNLHIVDVPSGEEAILVNSRQPFDLLVVDVRLPGISGLELIEHVHKRNPDSKIILVTGVTDSSIREQVKKANVVAHFFKPVDMDEFIESARRSLNIEAGHAELEDGAERPSAARISERLSSLRSNLQAHCALLLSERGEFVAQAGVLPRNVEAEALAQAGLTLLNAVEKTAHIAGSTSSIDLTVINGENYDLALTHVSQSIGLLLIAAGESFKAQSAKLLTVEMQSAASDLCELLSEIGVPMEPIINEVSFTPLKPEEPVTDSPEPDLDEIFRQIKRVKTTDADVFWDSIVQEDNVAETSRSDALSYEQARQLGLAPDKG